MAVLGGMMGPSTEPAATMAAEKGRSYPASSMKGIMMAPTVTQQAMAEPVMAAKRAQTMMVT